MLSKNQGNGRKSSQFPPCQAAQYFGRNVTRKPNLARFMHSTHGSHERNPLPKDLGIAIYGASDGFGNRARNEKELKMTASLSRASLTAARCRLANARLCITSSVPAARSMGIASRCSARATRLRTTRVYPATRSELFAASFLLLPQRTGNQNCRARSSAPPPSSSRAWPFNGRRRCQWHRLLFCR